MLGTVAHTITLLASSFVEEEHQTWYFFTLTAVVLLILHTLYRYQQDCKALHRQRALQEARLLNADLVCAYPCFSWCFH